MAKLFRLNRDAESKAEQLPTPDFFAAPAADAPESDIIIGADGDVPEDSAAEAEDAAPQRMVLRTDNLVKKYGKRTVVNHVSIDVTQGEIVGLLGPNGAGKTTTFYMTVGLIQANEGRIFINDLDITKYPV